MVSTPTPAQPPALRRLLLAITDHGRRYCRWVSSNKSAWTSLLSCPVLSCLVVTWPDLSPPLLSSPLLSSLFSCPTCPGPPFTNNASAGSSVHQVHQVHHASAGPPRFQRPGSDNLHPLDSLYARRAPPRTPRCSKRAGATQRQKPTPTPIRPPGRVTCASENTIRAHLAIQG